MSSPPPPIVKGDLIATYGTKTYGMQLFGVDPKQQTVVTTIGQKVTKGDFGDGAAPLLGLRG